MNISNHILIYILISNNQALVTGTSNGVHMQYTSKIALLCGYTVDQEN